MNSSYNDTPLPWGLDFDRHFSIPFIQIWGTAYASFSLPFIYPMMIWLIARHSPNFDHEYRLFCIGLEISLALGDLWMCFAYRLYPTLPVRCLICTGFLCRFQFPAATFLVVLAVIHVVTCEFYLFLIITLHQRILCDEHVLKLSNSRRYYLFAIMCVFGIIVVILFALFGGNVDEAAIELQKPHLQWVREYPSVVVYGTLDSLGHFAYAVIYFGITLCLLTPIIPACGLHACAIIARQKRLIRASLKTLQAQERAMKMLLAQIIFSLSFSAAPMICLLLFISFSPPFSDEFYKTMRLGATVWKRMYQSWKFQFSGTGETEHNPVPETTFNSSHFTIQFDYVIELRTFVREYSASFAIVMNFVEHLTTMFLFLLGGFLAFVVLYAFFINRIKGLPPGPPPLPFLGNLLSMEEPYDKLLFAWRDKYGPVFTVWMPRPTIIIMGHKEIQETLVQQADTFAGAFHLIQPLFGTGRPIANETLNLALGGQHGLLISKNSEWKEQRKFALHALGQLGFGSSSMQNTIADCAREIVERLKATNGATIRVRPYFMYAVANVIWQLAFGRTVPFEDPMLASVDHDADQLMTLQGHPFMMLLELIGSKWARRMDWMSGGEANFDADSQYGSYVEAYLQEQEKRIAKTGDVGYFTRHQLLISAYDMWFAGFETTVTTLRFGIHFLINRPDVQAKMQAEIDAKIGKREIRMEDQCALPYCCAVIHETQRLGVLASFNMPHHMLADGTAGGLPIPAGVDVYPQVQFVHIDEREFERPDYFCPERFLNEDGEFVKDPRVSPFSVGRRACLGENLARMELFIFLTTFVQHLTFASPNVVPPALEIRYGFIRSVRPFDAVVKGR